MGGRLVIRYSLGSMRVRRAATFSILECVLRKCMGRSFGEAVGQLSRWVVL